MNPTQTFHPWVAPLGWLALEAAVVVLAALVVQPLLRTAAARRSLWRAALLAMLALLALELTGTGSELPAQLRLAWQTTFPAPVPPPEPPPILEELPPTPPPIFSLAPAGGEGRGEGAVPTSEPLQFEPAESLQPPSLSLSHSPTFPPAPTPWPAFLWLTGLTALLARAAWTHAGFAWLRLRHFLPAAEALRDRVQTLAARLGLRCRVRVLASARLHAPAAFGWVRPGVGVPGDFTARYAPAQQDVMLAHELAHLAARDPLWQLLADLAVAALWWHPLAWVARHQHRLAAELAADDASQALPDGPVLLAECLLALGQEAAAAPRAPLGMAGFRSQLGRRVERLVALPRRDWQTPTRLRLAMQTAVALTALAALALLPGCAANRSASEAPPRLLAHWWQAKKSPVGDDVRSLQSNAEAQPNTKASTPSPDAARFELGLIRQRLAAIQAVEQRLANTNLSTSEQLALYMSVPRGTQPTPRPTNGVVVATGSEAVEQLEKAKLELERAIAERSRTHSPTDPRRRALWKQLEETQRTLATELTNARARMDVVKQNLKRREKELVNALGEILPSPVVIQGRVSFNGTPPPERDIPIPPGMGKTAPLQPTSTVNVGSVTTVTNGKTNTFHIEVGVRFAVEEPQMVMALMRNLPHEQTRSRTVTNTASVMLQEFCLRHGLRHNAATGPLLSYQDGQIAFMGSKADSEKLAQLLGGLLRAPLMTRFHRISTNGGLADVLVYVKAGLPNEPFPAPTNTHPIRIRGLEYEPYITAVQVGQPIRWESDMNLNLHPTPTNPANREFNFALMPSLPVEATFTAPEFFLRTKDDVHPWLFGYVSVLPHPFFAVTDADGRFRFPRPLPPGKYTLAAVHRQTGEAVQELDLTVPQPAEEISFVLSPKAAPTYIVAVGDEVRMEVYQRDNLRTLAKVQPDGTLTFPLIGAVQAAGKNLSELRNAIRDAYESAHFRPAHITVTTVQLARPLAPPSRSTPPNQVSDFTPSKPPTRAELLERKAHVETQLKEAEKTFSPTHPKQVGLRKQLETIEEALKQTPPVGDDVRSLQSPQTPGPRPQTQPSSQRHVTSSPTLSGAHTVLAVGDHLRVEMNYSQSGTNRALDFRGSVASAGYMPIPRVTRAVFVAGKTIEEAQRMVCEQLLKDGVEAPRVTLTKVPPLQAAPAGTVFRRKADTYRIQPGDELIVSVWGRSDLRTKGSVQADGAMKLPLVEDVQLAGHTITDARAAIKAAYQPAHLAEAHVAVQLIRSTQPPPTGMAALSYPTLPDLVVLHRPTFERLAKVRLPEVSFNGTPLPAVLQRLSDGTQRLEPDRDRVMFELQKGLFTPTAFDPPPSSEPVNITNASGSVVSVRMNGSPMRSRVHLNFDMDAVSVSLPSTLRDVSALDALDALVEGANYPIRFTIETNRVIFWQRHSDEPSPTPKPYVPKPGASAPARPVGDDVRSLQPNAERRTVKADPSQRLVTSSPTASPPAPVGDDVRSLQSPQTPDPRPQAQTSSRTLVTSSPTVAVEEGRARLSQRAAAVPPADGALGQTRPTNTATPIPEPLLVAEEEALRRQQRRVVLDKMLDEAKQFQKAKSWTHAAGRYEEAFGHARLLGTESVKKQFQDALAGLTHCRIQLAVELQEKYEFKAAAAEVDKVLPFEPNSRMVAEFKRFNEQVEAAHGGRSRPQSGLGPKGIVEGRAKVMALIRDGKLYLDAGEYTQAQPLLEEAIKLDPTNDAAFFYLRMILEAQFERVNRQRENAFRERVVDVAKKWNDTTRTTNGSPIPYSSQLTHSSKGAQGINRKLDNIVLPEVHFDAVPLVGVVQRLIEDAKKFDPEPDPAKKGLNFLINDVAPAAPLLDAAGNPVPVARPVALSEGLVRVTQPLKNLTLRQALDVICKTAELPTQFSVEEYAIAFIPRGPVAYYSRIFRVNPDTFIQGLQGVVATPVLGVAPGGNNAAGAAGQNPPTTTTPAAPVRATVPAPAPATQRTAAEANALVRQFFQSAGVTALGATNGSTRVTFNPANGLLQVRGTTNDLRLIEQAIQKVQPPLVSPPPSGPESRAPERDRPGRSSPASTNAPGTTLSGSTFYRTNSEVPLLTHSSKGAQRINAKLDEIILPEIHFDSVTLPGVVTWLDGNVKRHDPEKKGLNFLINNVVSDYIAPTGSVPPVLDPKGNPIVTPPRAPVSVKPDLSEALVKVPSPIKGLTLRQALDAICMTAVVKLPDGRAAGLKYSINDYAIVFSPKLPEKAATFSRMFKVDPETFVEGLRTVVFDEKELKAGSRAALDKALREKAWTNSPTDIKKLTAGGTNSLAVGGVSISNGVIRAVSPNVTGEINHLIRRYFTGAGVSNLGVTNGPDTTQVYFNDRNGLLLVRASLEDLDIIQMAIELLNVKPPQVMIEAKFAEMNQNDGKALGFDWAQSNAPPAATLTGVLTAQQFAVVLKALEQRAAATLVSLPKVTTTSGKQAVVELPPAAKAAGVFAQGLKLEVFPSVEADGYTIGFTVKVTRDGKQVLESRGVVWDAQTLMLGGLELPGAVARPGAKPPRLILFLTPTIVGPSGHRLHTDDLMPFAPAAPVKK